jgi:small subunit ribosomal protein S1
LEEPLYQSDLINTIRDTEAFQDEGWWESLLADEEKDAILNEETDSEPELHKTESDLDWKILDQIFKADSILEMVVIGSNRGGVLVQSQTMQGFVPISHLVNIQPRIDEEQKEEALKQYIGQKIELKIIELVRAEERIVLSERAAKAGAGKRKVIFSNIQPGQKVRGTVTNITDFGVFVDLGGIEGLIHVSELSWGRVEHPGKILQIGQNIDALVLNVNEKAARIGLSLKQLIQNPWSTISEVYKPGDEVTAVVTGMTKFGLFARLSEGVEGLVHISTFQSGEPRLDLFGRFKRGDAIPVKILHIDPEKKRIGLCIVDG